MNNLRNSELIYHSINLEKKTKTNHRVFFLPDQVGVYNQNNSYNVMRQHYRKILSPSFPSKDSNNAVNVNSTLPDIEQFH